MFFALGRFNNVDEAYHGSGVRQLQNHRQFLGDVIIGVETDNKG